MSDAIDDIADPADVARRHSGRIRFPVRVFRHRRVRGSAAAARPEARGRRADVGSPDGERPRASSGSPAWVDWLGCGVLEGDELAAAGQGNGLVEAAGP